MSAAVADLLRHAPRLAELLGELIEDLALIALIPALITAAAMWFWFVALPHHRLMRSLRKQRLCTDCTNPLPEGDMGPRCGDCWGRNYPG